MRVHHLITKSQGGAANATAKVHAALLSIGVESDVFFSAGPDRASRWHKDIGRPKKTPVGHLRRLLLSLARRETTEQFTLANPGVNTRIPASLADCDVLNIHWLGDNLFDLDRLSTALPRDLPVAWRLADLNAITGACHYPGACQQYKEEKGCRRCPFLKPITGDFLTRSSYAGKERFFRNHPVHLISISEWQHDLAVHSTLGRMAKSITLIHNPFQSPSFEAPLQRNEARQLLGLAEDENWICYGADNASAPRKGVDAFIDAVGLIQKEKPGVRIAVVGDTENHPGLRDLPGATIFGRLPPDKLQQVFSASDVFAMPTQEEALGQMGLEAISRGTPTVCYSDSGPCSYVLDMQTGRQVVERTPSSLARGILDVLENPDRFSQANILQIYHSTLRQKFSADGQARRYLNLYKHISPSRSRS